MSQKLNAMKLDGFLDFNLLLKKFPLNINHVYTTNLYMYIFNLYLIKIRKYCRKFNFLLSVNFNTF